jgi:uncharacterized protein with HEPN domain
MHEDFIKEDLQSISESIDLVEIRFLNIKQPDDFVSNNEGSLILDAISMRLQIVGELLKKVDKADGLLFTKYPDIEWKKIMKLRDIISHHYDIIDHEIIFDICRNHIPQLKVTVQKIIDEL